MKKILIQFDTDKQPSSFDRVVAVDAGTDELFSYGDIAPDNVTGLVHGAIFTRGPAHLKNTAIFIGGSNVADGEALLKQIQSYFFGPMRVSVMMDSNGCNTTAAAAVAAAGQHLDLAEVSAVVPGGTGPVGLRVAQILAAEGASVTLVSRSEERAALACESIQKTSPTGTVTPAGASSEEELLKLCTGKELMIAAGAAGVCFLSEGGLQKTESLKVAIDLNAVPPLGIADIGAGDKAVERLDPAFCSTPVHPHVAITEAGTGIDGHRGRLRC